MESQFCKYINMIHWLIQAGSKVIVDSVRKGGTMNAGT